MCCKHSSRQKFITFFLLFLLAYGTMYAVLTIQPAHVSAEEEEEEGGGQQQQQEESPAPPSDPGDTRGVSNTGSHRGHETDRLETLAFFSFKFGYHFDEPSQDHLPGAPWLTDAEYDYLCSMRRALEIRRSITKIVWFTEFLADLLQKPLPLVRYTMLAPEECVEAPINPLPNGL